jgi:hypothetical protein
VQTFDSPIAANLAKEFLEDAGLRTMLTDEATVGTAWHLALALGGIKLQVAPEDVEEALEVLAEFRPPQGLSADLQDSRHDGGGTERKSADDWLPNEREGNADRAFRGAVFGVMLWPLQIYVAWLVIRLLFSKEPLRSGYRWRAAVAGIINLSAILILVMFLKIYCDLSSVESSKR